MEAGTLVALSAMLISLFLAVVKYKERRDVVKKQLIEQAKKDSHVDVERDSIIVRGAEGALLLMEKTLKTANDECERRIDELEEENDAQRCEITELRADNRAQKLEIKELQAELRELSAQMKELTRRVDNG